MNKTIYLCGLTAMVLAFASWAVADPVEIPYDGWSNEFSIDTQNTVDGGSLILYNTDAIRYDAKWAEGTDRYIEIYATPKTTGVPYLVFTSELEEEGNYVFDYAEIDDPEYLPWYTDYTFSYVIYSGDEVIDTYEAPANVKIMPEPCFALIAVLALGLVWRRR